jgi:hypothetical protein
MLNNFISPLFIMQENTTQTKIQLSLSAIMFFSPFVKTIFTNKDFLLSDDDREFVHGYVTL